MSKAKAVSTNRVKKSREDWIFDIILYTIGVLLIIITLYPMYFIVIASFSDPAGQCLRCKTAGETAGQK